MAYVSDFADQAVTLPIAVFVMVGLGLMGWWRGCIAWLSTVGGTLLVILLLKAGLDALAALFGSDYLFSPSGHVAGATVIYGGLAMIMLRAVLPRPLLIALPIAVAIIVAYTRLALGVHTPEEVLAGAVVGLAGACAFGVAAGPRPLVATWHLGAMAACIASLFHGLHMPAEQAIRIASTTLALY